MKRMTCCALVVTATLAAGGGMRAEGQATDACAMLTASEWEAALGRAYYGPESGHAQSKDGSTVTSSCTYNFTEVLLRRPTDARKEADLRKYLERSLQSIAAADAESGHQWSVNVEALSDLGVPAVAGSVVAQEGSEIAGAEVYYVAALPASGEPTLLEVKSAESPDEARKIAGLFLQKF